MFPKTRSVSGKERKKNNVEQRLTVDKKKVNVLSKADIMFSSSSLWLLFISELPTSCQPATRFHRICEIREREPEGKSSTLLFRIQCCILILCQRKNLVLLETMYVDKIAKFSGEVKATFYNLCHEIFSHRFREGVRGFWTFPTSTFPPSPHPMWVLESMFFQGKDCVLLLKNTRSFKSFGHIIVSFDK